MYICFSVIRFVLVFYFVCILYLYLLCALHIVSNLSTFLDLHLSNSNRFVSSKIYYKCDDFDLDIVKFPFLDGDVPPRPS